MTEIDKDPEATSAKSEVTSGARDMPWSPTESSTDVDEKRRHNEDNLEHEEIEEAFPGHELDRQLNEAHDAEILRMIESRGSVKSKISRVLSSVSERIHNKNNDGEGIRWDILPQTNLREGIVGWEGQDDKTMPLNFSESRKWLLVALLSAITLVTPFASSILSPGISGLMIEFGETNEIVGSMTVSIYVLGYVIGCALAPNVSSLIVFRFFSGVGGAGCLTLGGGVIGDLFRPEQRGFAMGMWTIGPLFGPTIGPLIGGFIAETIGWRWDFWIVLIVAVLISVMIEIFNQETSHRVLIDKKVSKLKKELGRDDLRSCYDDGRGARPSQSRILLNALVRPLKMLLLSPIVLLLTIYISFAYGTLYLLFTTIPTVFEETYGFNVGLTGLVYLGLGSGTTLGWIIITLYSDKSVIKLAKANEGAFEPEMRLALSIFFSWLLPVTFFWYGWSAEFKVHWMSSIMSLVPFGMGIMGLFLPITT
ncbi:hypothetical protein VSDG_07557 [Cytospora chrysosperma]|uniref:Major facilitator superfamily (MFS) profile domain-containing protein n=1 Tax=Cytospora chrysosperma TaxID=252740 RepID=A0A423VMB9_CYTCH|nr:hypothetical protein VSDG_07557 [Valsa sordida]